jgi:hypothetical protein
LEPALKGDLVHFWDDEANDLPNRDEFDCELALRRSSDGTAAPNLCQSTPAPAPAPAPSRLVQDFTVTLPSYDIRDPRILGIAFWEHNTNGFHKVGH